VSLNPLAALPDRLSNLTALTGLNLSFSNLDSLPGWIGGLTALETLNLDGTELEDSGFAYCPSCER